MVVRRFDNIKLKKLFKVRFKSDYSETPSDYSETPSDYSETPSDYSETPSDYSETPSIPSAFRNLFLTASLISLLRTSFSEISPNIPRGICPPPA